MKQALNLKQTQRLAMTPQLQRAIKLLQMNTTELSEVLLEAHETNPLLEIEQPEERQEVSHSEDVSEVESSDESRDSYNEDWVSNQVFDSVAGNNKSREMEFEIPDRSQHLTLRESLLAQIAVLPLEPLQQLIAEYIVGYINDAGYLENSLEEINREINNAIGQQDYHGSDLEGLGSGNGIVAEAEILASLNIVQSLEPVGVGARGPGECLLLQLNSMDPATEGLPDAITIVEQHLPLLASRDYQTLRRQLKISEQKLKQAVELIQQLSPHPGYSVGEVSVDYVAPEILVEHHQGAWLARLNNSALPRVMINKDYQQLVLDNSNSASFSQLKEQLQEAKWLLSNIEKRHSTILLVASQIVERQQDFFDHGPSSMRPMIMKEIAEALDIHESTVSRTVNGKFMLTPIGLFELRYFFSTELPSNGIGNTSSVAVQTVIREMIEAEQPTRPISDMKICEALQARGFEVARRTVAKYREQMNIPPSSKRKSL